MTVNLANDVEQFLQDQVRAGVCSDPSALVNNVIRAVCEQQRRPFVVTPELEVWLLTSADESAAPLTKADFQAIRERVRARHHAHA